MAYESGRMVISALLALLFFCELRLAEIPPNYTFRHEATKAPKISFYDYIVIGGGASGIPLATTLSDKYSVLLLERRGSPYGNPNITNALNLGSYFSDASPNSPSQQFISEGVVNSRARKWQSAVQAALVESGVTPYNGFTNDHVTGTKVSGTLFDENGKRHTAADLLQYANPKGLSVLLHATVQKILFKTKGRTRPLAYGVVFEDSLGNKHMAYLKGGDNDEIILSAGALASPQLLMLSGIGPKEQLDGHRIKVVLQQPLVEKDMADNPMNSIFVASPIAVEPSIIHVVGFSPLMGGFFIEKISGPSSMGELKIENLNPSDNPSVTFNYFKDPKDLHKCVYGIKTILKAIQSKAFLIYKYANMTSKDILDLHLKLR
ncbi:protein HOTHEAD-like [Bidens hawaiensis]|uniref:protein HOTHEAD-like n=1 Tax=Bidens hawaiensis TaxID=980011 RepID=UPI004049E70A